MPAAVELFGTTPAKVQNSMVPVDDWLEMASERFSKNVHCRIVGADWSELDTAPMLRVNVQSWIVGLEAVL